MVFLYDSHIPRQHQQRGNSHDLHTNRNSIKTTLKRKPCSLRCILRYPGHCASGTYSWRTQCEQRTACRYSASLAGVDLKEETKIQFRWETLEHSPYSPDLSSCDVHVLVPLKRVFCGHQFTTNDEVCPAAAYWLLQRWNRPASVTIG
ncbi:mariner Mos1 transposase [Trichonephila clavipes]|nr:mariner Mos1 transposase [Trichonephila clavipes]